MGAADGGDSGVKWDEYIRAFGAALASIASFLWGGFDFILIVLLVAILLDYVSGIVVAALKKELSSKKGLAGMLKKVLYLLIVAVGQIVDTVMNAGGAIRGLVIGYLIANEGLSILENCARGGAPVPKKLIDALEQLRGDDNDDKTV